MQNWPLQKNYKILIMFYRKLFFRQIIFLYTRFKNESRRNTLICIHCGQMSSPGYRAAPEINISPVLDIVSGSRHFVPVTRRCSVYDILLKYENLMVIVTARKPILSVTYEKSSHYRAGQSPMTGGYFMH